VGDGVLIHEHSWLAVQRRAGLPDPVLIIEDDTKLNRFVKIVCLGSVHIGKGALISDRVYISDVEYLPGRVDVPSALRPLTEPRPVIIEAGVFIGVGAIIKPGVHIGRSAYIGAGSIVTKDVPERTLAVGAPARLVRQWDVKGEETTKAE
jgi:acetyltransferase-like isoleucine patch superfamily enzyme